MNRQKRKSLLVIASMFMAFSLTQPAFGMGINPIAAAPNQAENSAKSAPTTENVIAKYVPDRVLMKYKSNFKTASVLSSTITNKLVNITTISSLDVQVLNLKKGTDIKSVIEELKKDPNVLYAEPDYIVLPPKITNEPNFKQAINEYSRTYDNAPTPVHAIDPLYNNQWALNNTGQTLNNDTAPAGTPDIDMDVPEAWGNTKSSSDIIVAVIDTGVQTTLPDLAQNIWINSKEIPNNHVDDDHNGYIDDVNGWDFAHNDNSLFDLNDKFTDFHGTQIASVIAASTNEIGISGVAPNVKIMPLKFFKLDENGSLQGDILDAAAAITYAQNNGAKIAYLPTPTFDYSQVLRDAIEQSTMLIVSGAGEGVDLNTDLTPSYPSSFKSPNVLNVTAVDRGGNLYGYTDIFGRNYHTAYGKQTVDVAAPGDYILSESPDYQIGFAAEIHKPAEGSNKEYKAIYNGIGFEQVPIHNYGGGIGLRSEDDFDPTQRQDMFDTAMNYLKPDSTTANSAVRVLLVQDTNVVGGNEGGGYCSTKTIVAGDPGGDPGCGISGERGLKALNIYNYMLQQAGYTNVRTITPEDQSIDGPDFNELKRYDIVIWFTGTSSVYELGEESQGTFLTKHDQDDVTKYLNNGGRLLLTGQDSIDTMGNTEFVKNTLNVFQIGEDTYGDGGAIIPSKNTIYQDRPEPYKLKDYNIYFNYTVSTNPSITKINLEYNNGYYRYKTGPDFAAANAAGAAALVFSQFPKMDAAAVRNRLMNSGTPLSSLSGKTVSGNMINAFRAVWDKDIPGTPLQDSSVSNRLDSTSNPNAVYAVDLKAGDQISLSLSGEPGTDFNLALYNPSATTITSSEELITSSKNKNTSNEAISYTVTSSGTYYVNVNALNGSGKYTLSVISNNQWGTFQETNRALLFNGFWSSNANSLFSGGALKQLKSSGNVEFSFKGNQIEWIGSKNSNSGIAKVSIDGEQVALLSLYSETPLDRQSVLKKSLKSGSHTIKIEWTGQQDPESKGTFINVDAFIVSNLMNSLDTSASYKGIWGVNYGTNFTGGAEKFSNSKNASVEILFTGTRVTLLSNTGKNRGKAYIYLDDNIIQTVDLYSFKSKYQVPVFTSSLLSNTRHKIKLVNIAEKNPLSTGTFITFDALDVLN
ncbi:hypothetical protein EHS13_30145 [Paenibacillus psychroresistens]|uniref:Peptidase n=1 Tax=Paenibacillus psychroresistens TaxID=1778678 RepID=A0A6B8RSC2_9BACL|nr:S8 family serine peptidase [Paenibacillus psychroresistens]QGQ98839.1 hypothetical protein EHS13_30145 [Paenibacillus psychroresistens]